MSRRGAQEFLHPKNIDLKHKQKIATEDFSSLRDSWYLVYHVEATRRKTCVSANMMYSTAN
jgi:hypothetical protein